MACLPSFSSSEYLLELLLGGELSPVVGGVVPDPVCGDGRVQHLAREAEGVQQGQRLRCELRTELAVQVKDLRQAKKKKGGGEGSYGGDAEPSGAQLVAPTLTCPAWAAVTCPFSTNQARSFSKVDSRWRWKSRRSGASREVPLTSGPLRTSLKASAMMRSA